MQERNKALVQRLVDEAINQGKLDVVDELFSPELAGVVRQGFEAFRTAFPDWREAIVDIVGEGDRIAVRFECTGTLTGKYMGIEPNGRKMSVAEVFFLKVRDGQIVEYWGVEDELNRLQQLQGHTELPLP